uniref:UDP-glucuronosyltransferase n=1 Tax=Ascaris lumbricoides TaxID=6252 RepID=A0A0M3IJV7_ASCLU
MNYAERLENFMSSLITYVIGRMVWRTVVNEPFHKYIRPNFDITETISKSTFVFVNADEFVEFPRPITHKIVYVGGIAVDKPKPLRKEFRKVMDAAIGGAVLISFGSIAESKKMTPTIKTAFVHMMRSFPQLSCLYDIQFIWKYEVNDDIAEELPNETISKSTFVFVNADEFVEFPRPITHKIVYVGGIAVDKPKPLRKEFRKVMDAAIGGAVLISFGSIAESKKMTPTIKTAFVHMMRSFPQLSCLYDIQFIWKYEVNDDIAEELPNVLKSKWIPQNDLLAHPNMRAFVSHGGMNSLTESVRAGVPIVCIPLFGDQMRNAKMVEKRHVAVLLDKQNLTADALVWALKTVLADDSFLTSSRRLAKMIAKKPFSVEERIVKYTEFAVEFGHVENLDPAARKLNFFQYYLIDVIVPLVLGLSLFIYLFVKIVIFIVRKFIFIGSSKSKLD